MDLVNTVRTYIGKDRLENAINQLVQWAMEENEAEILEQLTVHQRSFQAVKRSENMGVLTFEAIGIEKRKITLALLDVLKEVEHILQNPPAAPKERTVGGNNAPENNKKCILFLASNPSSTAQLQLEKEFVQISQSLQDNLQFRVVSEWATTPTKLQNAILKYKPTLIHFSGHGTSSDGAVSGSGRGLVSRKDLPTSGIVLQDEKGASKVVSGDKLSELFSIFIEHFPVEVVLLNACYSEDQARMIASCISYVVGMNDSVEDDAAIRFSNAFYNSMAMGANVELAFKLAKSNVSMNDYDSAVLVLYKNGALYAQ